MTLKRFLVLFIIFSCIFTLPSNVKIFSADDPNCTAYTSDADFDKGVLDGVEHNTVHDQLQLMNEATTFPFIWVPNSDRGSISKIDTRTGKEIGCYLTGPEANGFRNSNGDPSRTTVDINGNCWVGNRGIGTAIKIGLFENGQYVDRNNDGIIQTSQDVNGDGVISNDEILPWGEDECVIFEIVLIKGTEGTYKPGMNKFDYSGIPIPRSCSSDRFGNIWIGTYGTSMYYYIDGESGTILNQIDVSSVPLQGNPGQDYIQHTPYGSVIDKQGNLWSSGLNTSNVLKIETLNNNKLTAFYIPTGTYGLGLDDSHYLYISSYANGLLHKVDTLTNLITTYNTPDFSNARGVCVTKKNNQTNIWVVYGFYENGSIVSFSETGTVLGIISNIGSWPLGIAADSLGKIWVMCNYDMIHRIDPNTKQIDFSKPLLGVHYSYSDMTGIIVRNRTTKIGTWTVIKDSAIVDANWGKATWSSITDKNSSVIVQVRSSNDKIRWSQWEKISNAEYFDEIPPGRYLEIKVIMQIFQGDISPILKDLTICFLNQKISSLCRTYTLNTHFDKGVLDGVIHTPSDQLQLSSETSTFPFIWIPNEGSTDSSSISKINTDTGKEIGRYRTCPTGIIGNPSRTTIDLYGNCWVGNRQSGSAVKVGLFENGQYLDRNHDGIIQTSRDVNGDGIISGEEILPWGEDECVLYEIVLIKGEEATYVPGSYHGPYPNNFWDPGPRGFAVDKFNNVWIGAYGSMMYYYINGNDGSIMKKIDVSSFDHHPYGAAMDQAGSLWSVSYSSRFVLKIDIDSNITSVDIGNDVAYGICLDKFNNVLVSGQNNKVYKINIFTNQIAFFNIPGGLFVKGICSTNDGDIWVVSNYNNKVFRYSNDGILIASFDVGSYPTGVAEDRLGKVFVIGQGDESVRRIDPLTNTVDLMISIAGTHYGYSDMTGIIVRNRTTKIGSWTIIRDSLNQNTYWDKILWTSNEPTGTVIKVEIRSSNDKIGWSTTSETVLNGHEIKNTPPGRYLEVKVTLQILDGKVSPILYDLSICRKNQPPSVPLNLTAIPSCNIMNLKWSFSNQTYLPISGYEIYRSKTKMFNDMTDSIGSVPATINTFRDNISNENEFYYYIVKSFDMEGNHSKASNIAGPVSFNKNLLVIVEAGRSEYKFNDAVILSVKIVNIGTCDECSSLDITFPPEVEFTKADKFIGTKLSNTTVRFNLGNIGIKNSLSFFIFGTVGKDVIMDRSAPVIFELTTCSGKKSTEVVNVNLIRSKSGDGSNLMNISIHFKNVEYDPTTGKSFINFDTPLEVIFEIIGGTSPYNLEINWGDGSNIDKISLTNESKQDLKHKFIARGDMVIKCKVSDSIGRSKEVTLNMIVK